MSYFFSGLQNANLRNSLISFDNFLSGDLSLHGLSYYSYWGSKPGAPLGLDAFMGGRFCIS